MTLSISVIALGGVAQTTSVVKVNQNKTTFIDDVKIFPNPATDRFTINIDAGVMKYMTINNIIGKEIRRVNVHPLNSYRVDDLRRGVYIIRIFNHKDELVKALRLSKT